MQATKILSGAILVIAIIFIGSPAYAHGVVEDRDPLPDSTVQESPVQVSISADSLFPGLNGSQRRVDIFVRDSEGLFYGSDCVEIVDLTVTKRIPLGQAGIYEVVYQSVSADGHTLSDSYTFSFQPLPGHTPTAGKIKPVLCGGTADIESQPNSPSGILEEGSSTPGNIGASGASLADLKLPAAFLAVLAVIASALISIRKPKSKL